MNLIDFGDSFYRVQCDRFTLWRAKAARGRERFRGTALGLFGDAG